jgi:ribonuclease-3
MIGHKAPTDALQVLQARLQYNFAQPELLQKALTHSTYANETAQAVADYERLEFVGDAVLDLLVATLLFALLPNACEGELSRRRARVVRWETLSDLASELQLGAHVRLGRGQSQHGGGASPRILADTFEAVVGAVFMDGGYGAVQRTFAAQAQAAIARTQRPVDFKTRLQEVCHQRAQKAPTYGVEAVSGPDHARTFSCTVQVGAQVLGSGQGSSKRTAEQQCAQAALRAWGIDLATEE